MSDQHDDQQPTQLETVSFRIPAPLKRWLTTESRRRAVSKSDVVRQALERERERAACETPETKAAA
jgi:Arc/MetJ-type ribon-helix-helix transcriptional regulator